MGDDGIGDSGYTLEQLSEYLDRGRTPAIPEIDADPECQEVLRSLERMGALSRDLIADEATPFDENWFAGLMREVAREVRAGRDIPLPSGDERTRLFVTEGALRGLLRELGDAVPGVIVERTRFVGDPADPEAEVALEITVSIGFGRPIPGAADEVRRVAREAVARHSTVRLGRVDVTVDSIHGPEGTTS